MAETKNPVLFFDTNQWRGLPIGKEITLVLNACKSGNIEVFLSELVIFEYARQYYERQRDAIISHFELIEQLSNYRKGEVLQAYHLYFESMFREYGVNILDHSNELDLIAKEIILDEQSYFSSENLNDQRDARILASALEALRPDHSVVFTADGNLKGEFERRGFSVETNARDFVRGLRLERTGEKLVTPNLSEKLRELRGSHGKNFPDTLHLTLQEYDPTYAALFLPGAVIEKAPIIELEVALQRVDDLGRDDREIRLRILSYVHWFAPISKDDLVGILQERQIAEDIVLSNSERLVAAGTIRDTGTHYLPEEDGVCRAIADSRIDELTELI